jgi:hypothetical protein
MFFFGRLAVTGSLAMRALGVVVVRRLERSLADAV